MEMRRMDQRMRKNSHAQKSCRITRHRENQGTKDTTSAVGDHKEPANRSRKEISSDSQEYLHQSFGENFEDQTQQAGKEFFHRLGWGSC